MSQKFREAEISESEDGDLETGKTTNESKNDVDAFDYSPDKNSSKKKRSKKLTKKEKKLKQQFLNDSAKHLMPSSDEYGSSYDEEYNSEDDDIVNKIFGKKGGITDEERER